MNIAKCPRCGKTIQLTRKTAAKTIKCPHCNCMMKQDKRTDRKLLFVKIGYAAIFILLISFIYSFFSASLSNVASVVIIVVAGIGSAATSEVFAQWFVFRFLGFTYERQ